MLQKSARALPADADYFARMSSASGDIFDSAIRGFETHAGVLKREKEKGKAAREKEKIAAKRTNEKNASQRNTDANSGAGSRKRRWPPDDWDAWRLKNATAPERKLMRRIRKNPLRKRSRMRSSSRVFTGRCCLSGYASCYPNLLPHHPLLVVYRVNNLTFAVSLRKCPV